MDDHPMSASAFADTPQPPYYIVAFSSQRSDVDDGYGVTADDMVRLASLQPGFLGIESARGNDGFGISNSFWRDEQSIRDWKRVVDHLDAQKKGRESWYLRYQMRVALVERAYGFQRKA